MDEYLADNQDVWTEFHKTRGDRSDSYEGVVQVKFPNREGFADFIGKSTGALLDWEEEHPEFGGALSKIDREHKSRLVQESLACNYNPVLAKLLLSHNRGMAEKTDNTQRFKDEDSLLSRLFDASQKTRPLVLRCVVTRIRVHFARGFRASHSPQGERRVRSL